MNRTKSAAARRRGGHKLLAGLALALLTSACVYVPEEAQTINLEDQQLKRPSAPLINKVAELPNRFTAACDIEVSSVWIENPGGQRGSRQVYMLFGESEGEACEQATLKLALRAPNGRVLWRDQFSRSQIYGFSDAQEPDRMRGRLIDWITNIDGLNRTTRQLPTWPEQMEKPYVGDGNPFLPARDMTREEYEKIRLANRPLYCYTAGPLFWNCLALIREENEVKYLGIQTFKRPKKT